MRGNSLKCVAEKLRSQKRTLSPAETVSVSYCKRDECYVKLKMPLLSAERPGGAGSTQFTCSDCRPVSVRLFCCCSKSFKKNKKLKNQSSRAHYFAATAQPFFRVKIPVPVCLRQHLVLVRARCKLRYSTFNCESRTCHDRPGSS